MKKNYFTLVMVPLFFLATGFIIFRYSKMENQAGNKIYQFQKRKSEKNNGKDWMYLYKQAEAHQDQIKKQPGDVKSKLALASIFIEESRAYGNHAYYDEAALFYVNDVLKTDEKNFEAAILKSVLLLSQHRFEEARINAEKIKQQNPYNAFVYGILTDANVELGEYKNAINSADQMVSIRPDIRSYSRIGYLREIYGDYPGAIDAMKMAIEAGAPGNEGTEWSRVQLGKLFENTGKLAEAREAYETALVNRPGYGYAMIGLGRLALHEKNTSAAISYFSQAEAQGDDPSFKEGLAIAYELSGDKSKAAEIRKQVIKSLLDHQHGPEDNTGHFHAGMELSYAYLETGDLKNALSNAKAEYERRPKNIDVNENLAWVYYKKGEIAAATKYVAAALVTGSVNPRLLARAALIYKKAGDSQMSAELIKKSRANNPVIDQQLQTELDMAGL